MDKQSPSISSQELDSILKSKKIMQYACLLTFVLSFIAGFVIKVIGYNELFAYVVVFIYLVLVALVLINIFLVNYKIHSLMYAVFRVLISFVPLCVFYVIYRSSYDVNKFIESKV
jgi:uncharacterized membrane protein